MSTEHGKSQGLRRDTERTQHCDSGDGLPSEDAIGRDSNRASPLTSARPTEARRPAPTTPRRHDPDRPAGRDPMTRDRTLSRVRRIVLGPMSGLASTFVGDQNRALAHRDGELERSEPGTREAENRVDRDGTAHARVAPPEQRALRGELARLRGRGCGSNSPWSSPSTRRSCWSRRRPCWSSSTGAFRLGLAARLTLLVLSLAGTLGFLGVRAVRRWRSAGLDELSLAMALDRFRPGTGQMIADVLQLPGAARRAGSSASPAMVRLAVRRACAALAESDWRRLWNRERTSCTPRRWSSRCSSPPRSPRSRPTPPG